MNFARITLGTLLSTPLLGVSGQGYDWDCNHYEGFPVDVCVDFGEVSFEFECNGTDVMNQLVYFGSGCDGTPDFTETVNNTNDYQCDQSSSCDYMGLTYYNDSDCSNEVGESAITTDQCINDDDGNSSYSFNCIEDDGEIAFTYYSESDCTGFTFTQYATPQELFGDDEGCIELTYCDSNLTGPPTTTALEDGTIGPFDCNLALWSGFWPFLEGECSYMAEYGNGASYLVECDSDGDDEYAMIYEYDTDDCSGSVINTTYPEYYYCGASSNECGTTTMDITIYNDTDNECDGIEVGDGEFNVATISGCYTIQAGFAYIGFNITDNSIDIGYYFFGSDCSAESRVFSFSVSEGCNDFNDSFAYVEFSSTDGTSGSSSSDSVDTTESTDDSDSSDSDSDSGTDSGSSSNEGNYTATYNSSVSSGGNTGSGDDDGATTIGNTNLLFTNFTLLVLFVIFVVIC